MIGQTISQYKILEKLGEGGMGIVYKAQDTKLDRMVALKFLPPHLSASEDDKARFIQEAKAASALNHPNVCTIHDIQDYEDQMFIVMEFVDGQTLRDKAKSQSLSLKSAIDIGVQIADGLAAAHEKGIVHRDIKPENIMVRKDGIAQIMDFGLAKLRGVSRLTKEGSTVGTAGYMSPEQVQGIDADHRSDIFSLGVLLYELITGQLPFKGVHETAIAYEIVNVDATPPSSVKHEIDPELDRIIIECLDKDPNERTQSVKQVAIDLKRVRRESGRQRASRVTTARPVSQYPSLGNVGVMRPETDHLPTAGKGAGWSMTAAIGVVAAFIGFGISLLVSPKSEPMPVIKASIEMPTGVRYLDILGGHSAISPDGSMIVFGGTDTLSQSKLWVRRLDSDEAKALLGTDNASYPFWSPNSKSIGFFSDGKVKTVDVSGGPVLTLANAPFGRGGAWSSQGEIIFSPAVSDPNLYAVPASGGTTRQVTNFDTTSERAPRFPFFLPDGDHFLFSMLELGGGNASDAYVGSLKKSESSVVMSGVSYTMFSSGYLFFLRQGILMTQPFDEGSLSTVGDPIPLQGIVNSWPPRAKGDFSVSESGILVYASSSTGPASELVWIAADGTETSIIPVKTLVSPALSPNGALIAYDELDDQASKYDLWIYDVRRKSKTRVTFSQQGATRPVWSNDGSRIYYNTETGGSKANIYVKRADGSGQEELLARSEGGATVGYYPLDVSPDGRSLLLQVSNESKNDLATIDLFDKQRPIPVRKLGIIGSNARFSPDGRWIVYQSNESGATKIYVSSFGDDAGKWQLSPVGGTTPRWLKDRIAYYSPSLNRHESVDVSLTSGSPSFSQPKGLFPTSQSGNTFIFGYSSDGKKFFGLRPVNSGSTGTISIVVNWKGLLASK